MSDGARNGENDPLLLRYSHNIIDHLGVKLYQNRPTSVIAELVSNAWDADAKSVEVDLVSNGDRRTVVVMDNGGGMSRHVIAADYLVIGRSKRPTDPSEKSAGGRSLMGRKGIGKLAPFGIAKEIDVISCSRSEMGKLETTWLSLELSKLLNEDTGSDEKTYRPPEYTVKSDGTGGPPDRFPKIVERFFKFIGSSQTGTMILLSDLSTKKAMNPDQVRESLGRRFTVTLGRDNFVVNVNGTQVKAENSLPELDFQIGSADAPKKVDVPTPKGTRQVKYWVGFVKSVAWPQEQAGIGVYVHGKLAQDRPFFFGVLGKEIFTRYMYGVVEADWLDEQKEDIVSTDRTSLDWESDEAVHLHKWGAEATKNWVTQFETWRREQIEKESIGRVVKVVKERELNLSGAETEAVAKLFTEISTKVGKDEEVKDKAVVSLAEAWIHLPMRMMTREIWSDLGQRGAVGVPEFVALIDKLKDYSIPEAMSVAVTCAQRIHALSVMEHRIHFENETSLQQLIERFPWLLDPEYEQLVANKSLKTATEEAEARGFTRKFVGNGEHDENNRPDFIFFSSPSAENLIKVVELKNPQKSLIQDNVYQLREYLDWIQEHHSPRELTGILIGSEHQAVRINDDRITPVSWGDILARSKKVHLEFLSSMLLGAGVGAGDARMKQIIDYGGLEARRMLNRMGEKNEAIGQLLADFAVLQRQPAVN